MIRERWRTVVGFEKYEVSDHGKIRNAKGKVLKQQRLESGYALLHLRHEGVRKTVLVHRCVATAFVNNKDRKPEVNHKDGVKTNNYYKNLEWATRLENVAHSIAVGLIPEHYRLTPVIGVAIAGNKVLRFESITLAETHFAGKKTANIAHCIRGIRRTAYGYIWATI